MTPAQPVAAADLSPQTCSGSSDAAGEPLAGSAPVASAWIVLEDPGPWGRDPLVDSALAGAVGELCRELQESCAIRTIAARHASRRRLSPAQPRNVWLAVSTPGGGRIRQVLTASVNEIHEWNLRGMANGELPAVGRLLEGRMEFICTHSGRDACCAVLGRAAALARPNAWECSHLGGHRFAATSLVLPDAACFGRLSPTATGDLDTAHLRGACHLPPELQVAEIAVRTHLGVDPFTPLWTVPDTARGPGNAQVSDARGQTWSVRCQQRTLVRRASCLADPAQTSIWEAVSVTSV